MKAIRWIAALAIVVAGCKHDHQQKNPEYEPCAVSDDACNDSLQRHTNVTRPLVAAREARTAVPSVAAVAYANPDSSKYTVRYVTSKPLRTGDSVRVRFNRDTVGGVVGFNQSKMRAFSKDSAAFVVDKVFGKLARYKGCARVIARDKTAGTESCAPFTTNFAAKPDTTPPVIDSIAIDSSEALIGLYNWPKVLTIKPGGTQQFCAYAVFKDGQLARTGAQKGIRTCDSVYALFDSVTTKPSPQQQYIGNHLCVRWTATGGTVTSAVCGVPS